MLPSLAEVDGASNSAHSPFCGLGQISQPTSSEPLGHVRDPSTLQRPPAPAHAQLSGAPGGGPASQDSAPCLEREKDRTGDE